MKPRRRLLLSSSLLCAGLYAVVAGQPAPSTPAADSLRWFKGNTHTHTLNSDGDSSPDDVVRWYRYYKYNFLVLTHQHYLTSVDGLNALHGADDKFLVVKGEEGATRSSREPQPPTTASSSISTFQRSSRRAATTTIVAAGLTSEKCELWTRPTASP